MRVHRHVLRLSGDSDPADEFDSERASHAAMVMSHRRSVLHRVSDGVRIPQMVSTLTVTTNRVALPLDQPDAVDTGDDHGHSPHPYHPILSGGRGYLGMDPVSSDMDSQPCDRADHPAGGRRSSSDARSEVSIEQAPRRSCRSIW